MKINRTAALFAATIIAVIPMGTVTAAGEAPSDYQPIYSEFNPNDVNGKVIISLPENVTAHVEITFDSPEGENLPYYSCDIAGGSEEAVFDIEGRDNTEDDFRNYDLRIAFTGGNYSRTGEVTDTFTVPDPNDNPKSFTDLVYTFTAADDFAVIPAELTGENDFGGDAGDYTHLKEYTLHLGLMLGDVNCDGIITGSDATTALREYTLLSSNMEGNFDTYCNFAADVNRDGILNGSDATKILRYYTLLSSNMNPSWDD